jgi:hypothetical protein
MLSKNVHVEVLANRECFVSRVSGAILGYKQTDNIILYAYQSHPLSFADMLRQRTLARIFPAVWITGT